MGDQHECYRALWLAVVKKAIHDLFENDEPVARRDAWRWWHEPGLLADRRWVCRNAGLSETQTRATVHTMLHAIDQHPDQAGMIVILACRLIGRRASA